MQRNRTAGKSRPGTPRSNRYAVLIAKLHYFRNFLCAFNSTYAFRIISPVKGHFIVAEFFTDFLSQLNPLRSDNLFQLFRYFGCYFIVFHCIISKSALAKFRRSSSMPGRSSISTRQNIAGSFLFLFLRAGPQFRKQQSYNNSDNCNGSSQNECG